MYLYNNMSKRMQIAAGEVRQRVEAEWASGKMAASVNWVSI